jgi:hypothetical protein
MEVLGAYLSMSMLIKDHTVVGTSVEIEHMPNPLAGQINRSDGKAE